VKYAAVHGASFGALQCLISLKLSKWLSKYSHFWSENDVLAPPLAEFWRYRKSETTKRRAMQSCIFHIPSSKLSDWYWWTYWGSLRKESLIFDVVRPLPRRPIKPAGSKYGTVANTTPWELGSVMLPLACTFTTISHMLSGGVHSQCTISSKSLPGDIWIGCHNSDSVWFGTWTGYLIVSFALLLFGLRLPQRSAPAEVNNVMACQRVIYQGLCDTYYT